MKIREFLAASAGGLFNVKDAEGNISSERICGITVATGLLVTGIVLIPFVLPFAIAAIGLGVAMFIGKGIIEAEMQKNRKIATGEQKLRDDLRALSLAAGGLRMTAYSFNNYPRDGNDVDLSGVLRGPSFLPSEKIAMFEMSEVLDKCLDFKSEIEGILRVWDKFNKSARSENRPTIGIDGRWEKIVEANISCFAFKRLVRYLPRQNRKIVADVAWTAEGAAEQKMRHNLLALVMAIRMLHHSTDLYNDIHRNDRMELSGDLGKSDFDLNCLLTLEISEVSEKCSDFKQQIMGIIREWDKFNESAREENRPTIGLSKSLLPFAKNWASRFTIEGLTRHLPKNRVRAMSIGNGLNEAERQIAMDAAAAKHKMLSDFRILFEIYNTLRISIYFFNCAPENVYPLELGEDLRGSPDRLSLNEIETLEISELAGKYSSLKLIIEEILHLCNKFNESATRENRPIIGIVDRRQWERCGCEDKFFALHFPKNCLATSYAN